jgi:hypothetical protein
MRIPIGSIVRRLVPRTLLPDVAINGRHSDSWNSALDGEAKVWSKLADIAQPAIGEARWWRRRVVIPLLEPHIASMPGGCDALVPPPEAVSILSDKARFANYALTVGALDLVPRTYPVDRPSFPAVLKRTDLNSGHGVALVTSTDELEAKLRSSPWLGESVVLQEAVRARMDRVTYVVCVRGRIVWHCSYGYPLSSRLAIRGAVEGEPMKRLRTRASDLVAFERLLRPLQFDGPANIDYRRRADGSIAILEINPRLGGSLMKPENVADLAACVRAIVRYARWRPPTRASVAVSGEVRA